MRFLQFVTGLLCTCAAANPPAASDPPAPPPPFELNLGAVLDEDQVAADRLGAALATLLTAILDGQFPENLMSAEDQAEHAFFVKTLKRIGGREEKTSSPPLIMRSFSPDGTTYLVTVAFMRQSESGTGIDRIVEFHAYPHDGRFMFRSPFTYRTRALRTHAIGDVRFHTSADFDRERAEAFAQFKAEFETLVGQPAQPLDYYRFDTLDELLRAHGIVYDCTKCNWLKEDLGFLDHSGRSFLTGTGDERYIFEYLVDYMVEHLDDEEDLYPAFVYGMATFYGDYGLSGDDLPTLKAQFRKKLADEPDVNFAHEFKLGRGSSVNRHFTNYVICAFICEEVVRHNGHDAMLSLAHAGRTDAMFLAELESLMGAEYTGLHDLVIRLIGDENSPI